MVQEQGTYTCNLRQIIELRSISPSRCNAEKLTTTTNTIGRKRKSHPSSLVSPIEGNAKDEWSSKVYSLPLAINCYSLDAQKVSLYFEYKLFRPCLLNLINRTLDRCLPRSNKSLPPTHASVRLFPSQSNC